MSRIRHMDYKYIVATVFIFGLFMDLLDMTITNVALPTLSKEFTAAPTTIEWVVSAYLLSLAVFIPLSGWAGDKFGTKNVFVFALSVFVTGSLLCGLAQSAEMLIAFRVVQGIGGGMMTPVGTAMLFRAFPPNERAKASALISIPAGVAPACGPVLGGYLVEFQSWHWIFFINIPVGLAGLIIAIRFLRNDKQPNPGRLDIPGFVLSASGLASLVYGLAEAGSRGFDDSRVILFGLTGVVLLIGLVFVEIRTKNPMIDMSLFKDKLFATANAAQLVSFGGSMGLIFLLPLFLQAERGMTPLQSGLTTFPQAIGMMLAMPFAGRAYAKYGPRRMMMGGMAVMGLATFGFLGVGIDTNAWVIRGLMFVRGPGFAFVLVPLQAATFATIPMERAGRASSVFSAGRQVAGSFGVALLATALANRMSYHGAQLGNPATHAGAVLAFHDAFVVAVVLTVVGIAAALLIDDKAAFAAMGRTPAAAPGGGPPASETVPAH